MRLAIVGVGQTLNFETGEMEDVLQVRLPDGQIVNVPTTNAAAQELVQAVMGNGHNSEQTDDLVAAADLAEMRGNVPDKPPMFEQDYGPQPLGEVTADGAVFGGDALPSEYEGNPDQIEDIEVGEARPTRFQANASQKLGDRSGLASRTLPASMVDEAGNPVLPAPAGLTDDDDDDDPGEAL